MNHQVPINFSLGLTTIDMTKLDNGKLYIGKAHQDPRTNPVNVFLDNAMTIFAPPFLRIKNGYIWHNGNIVNLYANEPVSALLLDVYDRQLWYFASLASGCEISAIEFDDEGNIRPPQPPESTQPIVPIPPAMPYTASQTKSMTDNFVKECSVPGKHYKAEPVKYTHTQEYRAESWKSQEDAEQKLQKVMEKLENEFWLAFRQKGQEYANEHGVCKPVPMSITLQTMNRFATIQRYDFKAKFNQGTGARKAKIYLSSSIEELLDQKIAKFWENIDAYVNVVKKLIKEGFEDTSKELVSAEHAGTYVEMNFRNQEKRGIIFSHEIETIDKQDMLNQMRLFFEEGNKTVVDNYNKTGVDGFEVEPKSGLPSLGGNTTTSAYFPDELRNVSSRAKETGNVSITLRPKIDYTIRQPDSSNDYHYEKDVFDDYPNSVLTSLDRGLEMWNYFMFEIYGFNAFVQNKQVSFDEMYESNDGDLNDVASFIEGAL